MLCSSILSLIVFIDQFFICVLSSASAAIKLDPWSLNTLFGTPLLLQDLVNAIKNDSLDSEYVTSLCTALMFRYVKIHPFLPSVSLPLFDQQRTKVSQSQQTKTVFHHTLCVDVVEYSFVGHKFFQSAFYTFYILPVYFALVSEP